MSARERHPRLAAFLIGLAAGVLTVVLCGVAVLAITRVFPLDQKCPRGEFPATNVDLGGRCFQDGATLPDGYVADPGGNGGL